MGKRGLLFLAISIVAMTATAAVVGFELTTEISADPYTQQPIKTEVEPDTYSFGSTIVGAFQVGRFADGGALDIGWATSNDNGKTWHHGFLPGITKYQNNGPYDRVSDASVAYDAKHKVWMVSSLAIYDLNGNITSPAIIVSRSTDGGLTWQNPVTIHGEAKTAGLDKNWTTCDDWKTSPYYGHCYTEWDAPENFNEIFMSTSTDGGLTWSAPQTTGDQASGLGGQPVVQPNGTVIVPIGDADVGNLLSFVSRDGGQTWSATTTVTALTVHTVGNNLRTAPLPSAAVDNTGKVYVVWQDCRFESNCSANDIVMSTTTDGINWSPVVRIPTDSVGSNVDHFLPAIAIDRNTGGATAHLSLTYYYYPNANCSGTSCELRVATDQSTDGGASWTQPMEIGSKPVNWNTVPETDMGPMVGDYISASFVDGVSIPIFAMSSSLDGLTMNSISANLNSVRELELSSFALPRENVSYGPILSVPSGHVEPHWTRLF